MIGHVDEIGNRRVFYNINSYLDWLFSKEFKGTHVWAHWGGHYDHRFIIAKVTKAGWSWSTIQSGNLLIIIKVRNPAGREILFCESARLMPDSVENIGKTVKLPKLDVDRTRIQDLTKEQVEEYCLRDCDIVLLGLQFLRGTITKVDGDFAYTLASISTRWVRRSKVVNWMKFYEKLEEGGYTYSTKQLESDVFCLPAYFGGRVEVFKSGLFKKKLYYYDITSSYPWSMTQDLPVYFKGFHPPPKDILEALDHCGISEATVFIPRDTIHLPILPIRHEGKLIFPEGHIKGRWTNVELLEMWKRGRDKGVKITIHGQARFKKHKFLKPFVDTFYGLRKVAKANKDDFQSYAYKILLNSLYGKLVENVERKSILYGDMVTEAIDKYGPNHISSTAIPGVYALESQTRGPFRHVAAGCYVTAYSRMRLLEGMEACQRAGGKVYYCDTDSIVTDKLITDFNGSELGDFKLEDELSEAEFVGPKVYRAITSEGKHIYKVKGMPIKGLDEREKRLRWDIYNYHLNPVSRHNVDSQLLSPDELERFSSKEGIAGFMTDLNKGVINPHIQLLKRQLKHTDTKRNHSGENSTPLYLDEAVTHGDGYQSVREIHTKDKKGKKSNTRQSRIIIE